ncbi:hypothetical protein AAF712_000705 [Marasmius tenuissimus]|uniref:Uncharacterized protein n=1 Tax=Marasmius tenuissimus TaxID=585030 RepID=A0ABR3ADX5_9AGAR
MSDFSEQASTSSRPPQLFRRSAPLSAFLPSSPSGSTHVTAQWIEKVDDKEQLGKEQVKPTPKRQSNNLSLAGKQPHETSKATPEAQPLSAQTDTASQQRGFFDAVPAVPYDPFSVTNKKSSGENTAPSSPKHRPPPIAILTEIKAPDDQKNSRPFSFIGPLPSPAWSCDGTHAATPTSISPPKTDSESSPSRLSTPTATTSRKEEQYRSKNNSTPLLVEGELQAIALVADTTRDINRAGPRSGVGASLLHSGYEQEWPLPPSHVGRGDSLPTSVVPQRFTLAPGRRSEHGPELAVPRPRTVSSLWRATDVGLASPQPSGQTRLRTSSAHGLHQAPSHLRPVLPPQTRSQTVYIAHHSTPSPAPRLVPGYSHPHPLQMSPSVSPYPLTPQDDTPDQFHFPVHLHQPSPVYHLPPSQFQDHDSASLRTATPKRHLSSYDAFDWQPRDTWNSRADVQYSRERSYSVVYHDTPIQYILQPSPQPRHSYQNSTPAFTSRSTWFDGPSTLSLDAQPPSSYSYFPPQQPFTRVRSSTLPSAPNPHYNYLQQSPPDIPLAREYLPRFQSSPDISIPQHNTRALVTPELLQAGPTPRVPSLSPAAPRVVSQYLANYELVPPKGTFLEAEPRPMSREGKGERKDKAKDRSSAIGFLRKSLKKKKPTKKPSRSEL